MKTRMTIWMMTVLLILTIAIAAQATILRAMSDADLVTQSERIVIGTVLDTRSTWNEDHSRIYTEVIFEVDEQLKGEPTREVVIRQPGGMVDGFGMAVAGTAQLERGDRALVYLKGPIDKSYLTAMSYGALKLAYHPYSGDRLLVRDMEGVGFYNLKAGKIESPDGRIDFGFKGLEVRSTLLEGRPAYFLDDYVRAIRESLKN